MCSYLGSASVFLITPHCAYRALLSQNLWGLAESAKDPRSIRYSHCTTTRDKEHSGQGPPRPPWKQLPFPPKPKAPLWPGCEWRTRMRNCPILLNIAPAGSPGAKIQPIRRRVSNVGAHPKPKFKHLGPSRLIHGLLECDSPPTTGCRSQFLPVFRALSVSAISDSMFQNTDNIVG